MAVARFLIHRRISDTVLASTAKVVDSIPEGLTNALEYHISLTKGDLTATKTVKLVVHKENGTLNDQIFSRMGNLNVGISTQISMGYIQLLLQNNESFDIAVKAVRAIT